MALQEEEEEGFVGNDDEAPIEPTQKQGEDNDDAKEEEEPLTRRHVWNLVFCLLAWGFTISNQTMGEYYY